MSVEQKIVDTSEEKIKALAPRAAKAAKNPETGVKILVPGAKFVIRDCAKITIEYLPLKLYGGFGDPLEELNGKFTKKEIESFVNRSMTTRSAKQLCNLMLLDARKKIKIAPQEVIIPDESDVDDVYGDYGSDSVVEVEEDETEFDFPDGEKLVSLLCEAFKVE